MASFRISKTGMFLLGVALSGFSSGPVFAGFEFSGAAPSVQKKAAVVVAEDAIDEPMPIRPVEDVTAEPLDDLAAGQVLKLPADYRDEAEQQPDPVYIRRQRGTTAAFPKRQPMDMDALLKATENNVPVPQSRVSARNNPASPAMAGDGKLVIDPYPLESETGASHGGGSGRLASEQAMMEQSGALRPVIVPGKTAPGMIARAGRSARHDDSVSIRPRPAASVADDAALFGLSASMTPIPGGEGEPLQQVVADMPAPAPAPRMPRPALPEGHPAPVSVEPDNVQTYEEAIGFGRDLPLALALSQIVPSAYSYAFGENVNVGSTVSWQGGKPWDQVLDEMLATQGLRAIISGGQVTIINRQA